MKKIIHITIVFIIGHQEEDGQGIYLNHGKKNRKVLLTLQVLLDD